MNRVRFLKKITLAASVFLAMSLTIGCSDDDDDDAKEDHCGYTVPAIPGASEAYTACFKLDENLSASECTEMGYKLVSEDDCDVISDL
jgi:hypothetical protein